VLPVLVAGGGLPDPGTHWEYQSLGRLVSNDLREKSNSLLGSAATYLLFWHTAPETQVVGPVQFWPPPIVKKVRKLASRRLFRKAVTYTGPTEGIGQAQLRGR
jgi:hypothetical protein